MIEFGEEFVNGGWEQRVVRDPPYIERLGWCYWRIVFPAAPGEGMDTAKEGYFTKLGARIGMWLDGR